MKRFLKKRWHSIPVAAVLAVLLVVLLTGSAFAAYTVWTHNSAEIIVTESIEVLTAADVQPEWPNAPGCLQFLPGIIYPGQGTCETYLIHNMGPVPISVTVTQTEPAGTEFAGLALIWANSTADVLIGDDGQGGFYYLDKICLNTEAEQILTYTFTIGTYEYDGLAESGGERYTSEKGDSAYVKVFAGFKVLEDATPGPFNITVTVSRG